MSSSDAKKPKFSVAIATSGYQKLINNTLGDPDRARKFVSSITSAVVRQVAFWQGHYWVKV